MGLNQICPIFPSESLYIKSMFFELFGAYLEGNAVSSTKGCARVCHYKMQVVPVRFIVTILRPSSAFSSTTWPATAPFCP